MAGETTVGVSDRPWYCTWLWPCKSEDKGKKAPEEEKAPEAKKPVNPQFPLTGCAPYDSNYDDGIDETTGLGMCTTTPPSYFSCLSASCENYKETATADELSDCLGQKVSINEPSRVTIDFDYYAKADTCYNQPTLSASIGGLQVGEASFPCSSSGSDSFDFCAPAKTVLSDIGFNLTSGDWNSSVVLTSIIATKDDACAPKPTSISMCGCKENSQYFTCLPEGTCKEPMDINGDTLFSCLDQTFAPGSWTIEYQYKADGGTCDATPPQLTFSAKNQSKTKDLLPCPGSGNGEMEVCIPSGTTLSDLSLSLTMGAWCSSLLVTNIKPSAKDVCTSPTQDNKTKWEYNGFTFTAYQSEQYCNPAFIELVQEAWLAGADTIGLLYTRYQDTLTSNEIKIDPNNTPSLDSLTCAIQTIKDYDMQVLLDLYVNVSDGSWRANIAPTSESNWFSSLKDYLAEMALFANNQGVDLLCVGAELASMTQTKHLNQWKNIVNTVRDNFKGQVLYFPNQDQLDKLDTGYWPLFDALGVNFWASLSKDAVPTTENLVNALAPHVSSITAKAKATNKKIFFGEIGYPSRQYCANDPWNCGGDGTLSPECQENAYNAFYQAWANSDQVMGALFWQLGLGDKSYDPNMCSEDSIGCCPMQQSTQETIDEWM